MSDYCTTVLVFFTPSVIKRVMIRYDEYYRQTVVRERRRGR